MKSYRKFTEQDNQFIKDNFKTLSSYRIAELLNRKQGSISQKIRELGLVTHQTAQSLQKQGQRRCGQCKQILPLESFYRLKSGRYGGKCKSCSTSSSREYHYARYSSLDTYATEVIKALNKRKHHNSLAPKDIINQFTKQNGLCYYTGDKLLLEANSLLTISVDRIDPLLPYQRDNMVLCCHIVNLMKQQLQVSEFINWCQKVVIKHSQSNPLASRV